MSSSNIVQKIISSTGDRILGNPFKTFLIFCVLVAGIVQYTADHLSINTDTAELIAPDAPFQQNRRIFEENFSKDLEGGVHDPRDLPFGHPKGLGKLSWTSPFKRCSHHGAVMRPKMLNLG